MIRLTDGYDYKLDQDFHEPDEGFSEFENRIDTEGKERCHREERENEKILY